MAATIKTADLTALISAKTNSMSSAEAAAWYRQTMKAAAKANMCDDDYLAAKVAKKIKLGAIRMGKWWHPVVNGEISGDTYQFSTAAVSTAVSMAGVVVNPNTAWQTVSL